MASDQIFDTKNLPEETKSALNRWRLILGKRAEEQAINFSSPDPVMTGENNQNTPDNQRKRRSGEKQSKSGAGGGKKKLNPGQIKSGSAGKVGRGRTSGISSKKSSTSEGYKKEESESRKGAPQRNSEQQSSHTPHPTTLAQIDNTLNFVYHPPNQKRGAGLEGSNLSIPKWIENVKKFFPKQTKEVLEKDFVERSDLQVIIKNPELFDKVEPSLEMVKVIISMKHMLPENIKNIARKIVKKVVDALKNKFKQEVERHIVGAIKRDKHTPIKVFRNIDWKQSIRRNLKNYDPKLKKLIMAEPRFFSAERRKKPWQIVVMIDESGSMTDSVIYSIVMASIFATLPSVHTNLLIFDTQVVDLSSKIDDPVDVLMSVQLGGGTDITRAVRYGHSLIKNPKKAIMVIISDFFEGGGYDNLTKALKQVLEGQTKILGIAALGYNSRPMYDRRYAKEMNHMGIDVLACTPKNLPELIAKLMK